MNKNTDFENNQQHILNDLNDKKYKIIQKIEMLNREVQQIDLQLGFVMRDFCPHNLIKSPEPVWIEENDGEIIVHDEYKCMVEGCLYKEYKRVEDKNE